MVEESGPSKKRRIKPANPTETRLTDVGGKYVKGHAPIEWYVNDGRRL